MRMSSYFAANPNMVLYVGGAAAIAVAVVLVMHPLMSMEDVIRGAAVFEDFAQTTLIPDNFPHHPFPIDTAKINPDGTVTVTFKGGEDPRSGRVIEFRHVETYRAGESFVWGCEETEAGAHLNAFVYLGSVTFNQSRDIVMGEYEALTREPMECRYPDVIAYSRNAVLVHADLDQGAASFAHAHFERMSAESNFTIACDDGANVVHWGGRDLAEKVLNSDEICEFP